MKLVKMGGLTELGDAGFKVNLETWLSTGQSHFKTCCPSQISSCPTTLMIQILPLCSVQKFNGAAA